MFIFLMKLYVSFLFLTLIGLNREHIDCREYAADVSLLGTGSPRSCNLLHDLNSSLEFCSRMHLLNLYVLTECDCVSYFFVPLCSDQR
jgi:hypothetical protein